MPKMNRLIQIAGRFSNNPNASEAKSTTIFNQDNHIFDALMDLESFERSQHQANPEEDS
tara:strand:- start:177 stop:353 length:177 start_codon:yes stop_codon:yes gene_type:complete